MAWRIDALKVTPMTQLSIDWGLCMGALLLVLPNVLTVTLTNSEEDKDENAVAGLPDSREESLGHIEIIDHTSQQDSNRPEGRQADAV